MKLQIGKPVEPMLVSESGASEKKFRDIMKAHKGRTLAEIKYDGYRIQVHKNSNTALYTRNLNPLNPEMFPELKTAFRKLPFGIYDGELAGLEPGIKGFNVVKKRMGGDSASLASEYPLQIRFFDILMLENSILVDSPLYKRRENLERCVGNVSLQQEINDPEELKRRFEETKPAGEEGLVCKRYDSAYQIGKRTKDWVKLKNFLTLDLVVLGLCKGEGKVSSLPFAALLLGTRNNNRYETISKVGISNRDLIEKINARIKNSCSGEVPRNIILSPELKRKTYARKLPYCYVEPDKSVVVEVETLNITRSRNWHSCGLEDGLAYSLRIPIVKGIREDKSVRDCNTTEQIADIYSS